MMLHTGSGLGAAVSASGSVNVPSWCSVVPFASSLFSQCAQATVQDTADAAQNAAGCQTYAQQNYPTTTALLGAPTACKFIAGDYNLWIGLGVAALAAITILTLK